MIVLVVLVATLSSGGDQPSADGPVRLPGTALPSPEVEDHAGVWASVYYVLKTDPSPERDGLFRISHGSECELFHR